MDYEAAAAQVIRALRGRFAQSALSRRLGYRSNVFHDWETGRAFPTAARVMALARHVGREPNEAVARFLGESPSWLATTDLATPPGVAALLRQVRGTIRVSALARSTERDRFAVARWLKGASEPRLPDFLRMIDAASQRLADFLAEFVDPTEVAEVADTWRAVDEARSLVRDAPWAHAVLRALELRQYRALTEHEPGWIATQLGISLDQEEECLKRLALSRQIRRRRRRWEPCRVVAVDARRDREASRRLACWGAELGAERIASGSTGYAFNLIAVSEADLQRLRNLQHEYFAQIRSIVAASEPAERVAIVNLHLLVIAGDEPAAQHPPGSAR